jgi:predicted nucleic acid-binding protein
MASNVIVDCSFLVALLTNRDAHHDWAAAEARTRPPAWQTCEAVVSEAFHLLGPAGRPSLAELLEQRALICSFVVMDHIDDLVRLMTKYQAVPMSFADACLVRMTEVLSDPVLLTTDSDFRIYRRHGRQVVPCITPR